METLSQKFRCDKHSFKLCAEQLCPNMARDADALSHASQKIDEGIVWLKPLGATQLKHMRDGREDSDSMLDLNSGRLLELV